MLWHNFKTRFLFELQTLPPSVAHGELAAPELQNLFPVCKWAPTNFGRKSVMPWIQKRIKAKKPNPNPPSMSCLPLAFTPTFESFSFLLPFLTASLFIANSCPFWWVFPLMSCQTCLTMFTSFIHMLLFHIVFLFCTTSVIFHFFGCHCFLWLSEDSRSWDKGQLFAFYKELWKSVDHINIRE